VRGRALSLVLAGLFLLAPACATRRASLAVQPSPDPEIAALQEFARQAGYMSTGNFKRRDPGARAFYRCYYTGKLELPDSYAGLKWVEGNAEGCPLNPEEYDIFFYPMEAVASGTVPVTASLEEAERERKWMVVAHEDFHNDPMVERLPVEVAEAVATLTGFLTVRAFFERAGWPPLSCPVDQEAARFYEKSLAVNRLFVALRNLYSSYEQGQLSRRQALDRKQQLFEQFQRTCRSERGRGCTFDPCLSQANNAALAFEATYTRWYPVLYEAYLRFRPPLEDWIRAMRQLGARWPEGGVPSEQALARLVESLLAEAPVASR